MSTPLIVLFIATLASTLYAQEILVKPTAAVKVCPGAFPTDLTATDCTYTAGQRALDFVSGSVTDQAVLGATVFGLGAQIIESPSEWKRTWKGYGQRVGARYTQAVGKGAAQYLVGWIAKDDPRNLAYRDDPKVITARSKATETFARMVREPRSEDERAKAAASFSALKHDGWSRFGHAWYDVITVRRSAADGQGKRIPAFSRFAGEFAGAYAGYPWYPGAENKFMPIGERAAGAFGTAALSSFYTEYKPEIARLTGAILRHGKQSKPTAGGQR